MKQPNILFLFPDQHRWDWLGTNPELPLRTPQIDALGARGTSFTRCYTPSPVCSPARACLATGRRYGRSRVRNNAHNTPLDLPNYYRTLRDAGYSVSGVGKFDLHKPDSDWGLDGSNLLSEYGFTQGVDNEGKGDAIMSFQKNGDRPKGPYMQFLTERGLVDTHVAMYEDPPGAKNRLNYSAVTALPDDAYCDNWIGQNAIDQIESFPGDRPWHLVVNFTGPHDPYDVTPDMRAAWQNCAFAPPHANTDADPAGVLERQQNYAAMIENIDTWVGRMLAAVEARGNLENTIVIYSSDHGEMLGDHDRWQKSVWHEGSTHVPLIVAGPGVAEGACTDTRVSVHDLAATFVDYAGTDGIEGADAQSLRPTLEDPRYPHRDVVTSALGKWSMARDARYKLVRDWEDTTLLFDLDVDPREDHNIADTNPDVVVRLNAVLDSEYATPPFKTR